MGGDPMDEIERLDFRIKILESRIKDAVVIAESDSFDDCACGGCETLRKIKNCLKDDNEG